MRTREGMVPPTLSPRAGLRTMLRQRSGRYPPSRHPLHPRLSAALVAPDARWRQVRPDAGGDAAGQALALAGDRGDHAVGELHEGTALAQEREGLREDAVQRHAWD